LISWAVGEADKVTFFVWTLISWSWRGALMI
jgi:hypothetical protein